MNFTYLKFLTISGEQVAVLHPKGEDYQAVSQNILPAPVGVLAKQDLETATVQANLILNTNKSHLQACSHEMRVGTVGTLKARIVRISSRFPSSG